MSRRIVPGTFWVGILACALMMMLLAGTMRASSPPSLPYVKGNWDGFFLAADGATGGVSSEISEQDYRRLAGHGVLGLESGDVAYRFRATLARPDLLTGRGVTVPRTGSLVFQAGLETYAPEPPVVAFQTSLEPREGDATVMDSEFLFVPLRGRKSRFNTLLLHPFRDDATPNIAGNYNGPFLSLRDPITGAPADPKFMGFGTMEILRNDRGYFGGHVDLFLDSNPDPFISWPFLATTSDRGRVIWISQQKGGRIIYDGVVIPAPDKTVARLDGIFRLLLNDGRTLYNAYNCPVTAR